MSRVQKILVLSGFSLFALVVATGLQAQTATNTATTNTATNTATATQTTTQSSDPTSCGTGMELCKSSDGSSSWCSSMPCSETTCNAKSGYEWCKPNPTWSGGQGWCNSTKGSCPVYDEASCTAKGKKWCKNSPSMTTATGTSATMSSGWCTMSDTEKCPVYTEGECTNQGGQWCQNPPMSGSSAVASTMSSGWCKYEKNSECPIYDQKTCESKSKTWCPGSTTNGWTNPGWCMANKTDWCSTLPTPPPPPTPTFTPPPTLTPPTTTPTPPVPAPMPMYLSSWPESKTDCNYYKGNWCEQYTQGYSAPTIQSGYCSMGTKKCEPNTKDECQSRGRYWCEFTDVSGTITTAAATGFCSYDPCTKIPNPGMVACPDGVSLAKTYNDCPHTDILPVTNINVWPSDKQACQNFKGTWCENTYSSYCINGNRKCEPKNKDECQSRGRYWCEDTYASGYKASTSSSGWCSYDPCQKMSAPGMMICPDGVTSAKTLKECPTSGLVPPPDYQKCPNGLLQMNGKCAEEVCPPGTQKDLVNYMSNKCIPLPQEVCASGTYRHPVTLKCIPFPNPEQCKQDGTSSGTVAMCPVPPKKTCPDGTKVDLGTACPDESSDKRPLTDREQKTVVAEVRYINSDLDKLEPIFKDAKDTVSLQKISDLRTALTNLPKDYSVFETLKGINDTIKDLRVLRQSILNRKKTGEQVKKDEQRKEKELIRIKKDVAQYQTRVDAIMKSIETGEALGIYVEAGLKGKLASIQSLLESVKVSTTYEDVRKTMLELNSLDVSGVFDEYSLQISVLPDMPFIVRNVDTKLTETRTLLEKTQDLLEKGEFDSESLLSDSDQGLQKIQTAFDSMKNFILPDDIDTRADFRDWVQSTLNQPLINISNDLRKLQELSRLNTFLSSIKGDISKYQKKINSIKKKADRKNPQNALNSLKREYTTLDSQKRKASKDSLSDLLPQIQRVKDIRIKLLTLLKQATPETTLLQDLNAVLKKIDEQQKTETLPSLDSLIQQTITTDAALE